MKRDRRHEAALYGLFILANFIILIAIIAAVLFAGGAL